MAQNLVLQLFSQNALLQHWQGRRLLQEWPFNSSDEAQNNSDFSAIIANHRAVPVTIVLDTANEELRTALIPKVIGSARGQLIQRTLLQAFPTMEYRAVISQGVVRGQRRDEKLLLMAITQEEPLNRWLALLHEQNAMVQKVTTASMVLAQLARQMGSKNEYELTVYRHSEQGLRQLFLHNSHPGLSRLSPPPGAEQTAADQFATEAANTRQYLNNSKAIPRDANLTVRVLHRDQMAADLTAGLSNLQQVDLQLINISTLARKLSLKVPDENFRAEHLLGWVVANFQNKLVDFAPTKVSREYCRFTAGRWTIYGAIVATTAMLVWSATDLFAVWEISRRADEQHMLLTRWQQLEQEGLANAIPTDTSPLAMKQATELVHRLSNERRFPERRLRQVAGVLAASPELRFRKIEWAAPGSALTYYEAKAPPPDVFEILAEEPESTPASLRETLFLELQIEPFSGDYLAALQRAELAVSALKRMPTVHSVEMVSTPLNVNSQTDFSEQIVLDNKSENKTPQARFQLVVTLDSSLPPTLAGQQNPARESFLDHL